MAQPSSIPETLSIRLKPEIRIALEKEAKKDGRKIAQYVVRLLTLDLKDKGYTWGTDDR